jgi:WD40 repeat protein
VLTLRDRKSPLTSLAFSPDGRRLAAVGAGGVVRAWELATQRLVVRRITHAYWANDAVFFMPDGEGLLVHSGWRLYRYGGDGKPMGAWPRSFNASVTAAAVSWDCKRLVLGVNRFQGALHQFALPEFEPIWKRRAEFGGRISALACSRDGRLLACCLSRGETYVCEAATGKVVHELDGASSEVKAVALSPDGRRITWCAATQLHLWRLDPPEQVLRHSVGRTHFLSVTFHPSGNFLASANGDGKVDYWDADGRPLQSFDWGVGKLNGVTFDATGDRAACCSQTGEVVVWDVDR